MSFKVLHNRNMCWVILLSFCLVACGRPFKDSFNSYKPGFTTLQFKNDSDPRLLDLPGLFALNPKSNGIGIFTAPDSEAIVYASKEGESFRTGRRYFANGQLGASSPRTWTIPNAGYRFSMIGYSNSGAAGGFAVGGSPICALGSAGGTPGEVIDLNGVNQTVSFSGGSCSGTPFKEGNNYAGFRIRICANAEDLSAKTIGSTCASDVTGVGAGNIRSVKVVVNEADHFLGFDYSGFSDNSTGRLASQCFVFSAGITSVLINFLAGTLSATQVRLPVEIALYTDTSCNNSNTAGVFYGAYLFAKGIAAADGGTGSDLKTILSSISGNPIQNNTAAKWIDGTSSAPGLLFLTKLD